MRACMQILFAILSPSAAVSSLFNSSSLEVTMFCFSSIPRMSCSFWYRTSFSWDVSTFICQIGKLHRQPCPKFALWIQTSS